MSSSRIARGIARGSERVAVLRKLPMLKLLAAAEVLLMAHEHLARLEPAERRRLVVLVRVGRGRRRNLSPEQQDELAALVAKAAPREFVFDAARKFSPIPLPRIPGRRRRGS